MDEGGGESVMMLALGFMVLCGLLGAWLGGKFHGQPGTGFVAGLMCGPIGAGSN